MKWPPSCYQFMHMSFCVDEEDPIIMCPADFSQNTDSGQPNATVVLPAPTAGDNSGESTTTSDPTGSPVLGIGSHTVTYTVTDGSGNSAKCNITIMIRGEPSVIVDENEMVHSKLIL